MSQIKDWLALTSCCLTIALANTALKIGSKCSFTTSKLRFFANFCLVFAALITFFNDLLTLQSSTPNWGDVANFAGWGEFVSLNKFKSRYVAASFMCLKIDKIQQVTINFILAIDSAL